MSLFIKIIVGVFTVYMGGVVLAGLLIGHFGAEVWFWPLSALLVFLFYFL